MTKEQKGFEKKFEGDVFWVILGAFFVQVIWVGFDIFLHNQQASISSSLSFQGLLDSVLFGQKWSTKNEPSPAPEFQPTRFFFLSRGPSDPTIFQGLCSWWLVFPPQLSPWVGGLSHGLFLDIGTAIRRVRPRTQGPMDPPFHANPYF